MKLNNIKLYFLLILLLVNGMIFYTVFAESRSNILKVIFLDIGQGDAIFIESPIGNQVLIDGGPNKNILNALGRVMPIYDRSIDMVMTTHPDQDHIGGIPEVLKNYNVGEYISNGDSSDTETFKELERQIVDKNIKNSLVQTGDIIDIGGDVFLEILYPRTFPMGNDTNKNSIVTKLYYGNSTFLLTGDIPTSVEEYLVNIWGEYIDSDVLKVAHHGSKNSLSTKFFSAVSPKYSVISASENNRYGHPHKEIIEGLESIDSIILETSKIGDIVFTSDGQNIYSY